MFVNICAFLSLSTIVIQAAPLPQITVMPEVAVDASQPELPSGLTLTMMADLPGSTIYTSEKICTE